MVRRSYTAVLEKNLVLTRRFETEPYEVPWASEARFFVRVLDPPGCSLLLRAQISPDGLTWCDECPEPVATGGVALFSFALRDFGHWLRLQCEIVPPEVPVSRSQARVMIYLALKE